MTTKRQKQTPPKEEQAPEVPPVEEQDGPPPLVEELADTNDFPEGESEPEQTTESDADFDEEETTS